MDSELIFVPAAVGFLLAPVANGVCAVLDGVRQERGLGAVVSAVGYLGVVAVAGGAAVATLWQAFRALQPRLERAETHGDVFFGDIARRNLGEWERRVRRMTAESLERDLTEQVHRTACIASIKFGHVRRAIRGTTVTVVVGLLAYALSVWLT